MEFNKVIKRFTRSSVRGIIGKALQTPMRTPIRPYATDRVHTPVPTTSSNDGLNNDPAIPFPRKNKASTVVQHPEWVRTLCDKPGCNGKTCTGLCGEKTEQKSIGHFTHSDKEKNNPHKFSDIDLDGNTKPLFLKPYKKPHETSSESYNSESDREKTANLQKIIKKIQDDANKQN